MKLWPHQEYGINETLRRLQAGETRLCLTSPTGGGKSLTMQNIIQSVVQDGQRVVLYSNRRLLTEQLAGQMSGVHFGVRAAGFEELDDPDAPVQICSIQTESSRVLRRREKAGFDGDIGRRQFPLAEADVVLVDEAHMQKADKAEQILQEHHDLGAALVGVTATPLGISHLYDDLIIAGTNSELRDCGALVKAYHYACPELDTRKIQRVKTGEFGLPDIRKNVWSQAIYGYVVEHLKRLNPELLPTILFAPGVDESVGFVRHLEQEGIKAAHIDGEDCFVDGERHKSNREVREQILNDVRSNYIKVVCNRFVLREAIDIPELYCCVLATPIGSLLSYVQIVGRVLRAHAGFDHVIIQDHGGGYWRHGSPNADRDDVWLEHFRDPERLPTDVRMEQIRNETEKLPVTCPKCGAVQDMPRVGRCYSCDQDLKGKRARMVIQRDGTLVEVTGLPVRKRRQVDTPTMRKAWEKAFYMCRRARKPMTLAQGRGMIAAGQLRGFESLAGQWPPNDLPKMPTRERDWFMHARDLDLKDLR